VNTEPPDTPPVPAPEPTAPSRSRYVRPDATLDRDALISALRQFISLLVRACHFDLKAEIRIRRPDAPPDVENPEVIINFHGRDAGLLLERGGTLLRAVEYLALRWLHLEPRYYDRIRFDCNDAKAARIEELKLAAATAAERVKSSGAPFRFNPMNARERRILHLALRDVPGVRTTSEGEGLMRSVVIYPAGPEAAAAAPTPSPEGSSS
jgi:spoIIIJ-associated protein